MQREKPRVKAEGRRDAMRGRPSCIVQKVAGNPAVEMVQYMNMY